MKRDLLCISGIIRKIEKSDYKEDECPSKFKIMGYSKETVDYHIQLLKDADFIKTKLNDKNRELPTRLTWKGHDYIDRAVHNTVNIIEEGMNVVDDLDL
ncbi:MAG: DUF2513 domain-containing protein [Aurantibacter sp.]